MEVHLKASPGNGQGKKIIVEDLVKLFEDLTVIEHVSLGIRDGEFLAIVGASGCGKSTLLRIMAGLIKPTAGWVLIDGKKMEGPNPRHNLVFQEHALYPWRTVFQNIALGLE